ncbi:hypothetical protein SAMN05518672_102797 [Chitinophaga sp. CF118]|uniref:hypothetical protein n=1 Tax=Chitinophaga sp. CF118 TaxID=1884367 RepID=UPI0008E29BF5|nr:hypothetical protein [Chitinophaga sp. CF118]SFD65144.1 hypothetical protein SAMN05518672_102797 [Chitinophaga sp. CF118]
MRCNQEDYQKARRIAKAIQDYFRMTLPSKARSSDIYHHLAKHNLIEKDRHEGIHFRAFLQKLKANNLLHLIPQCKWQPSPSGGNEWHFYRISDEKMEEASNTKTNKKVNISHRPITAEKEIDRLIELAKHAIEKLPKTDPSRFSYQQLEIRKNYQRAYEEWSEREIDIMKRAYAKFGRIDKVAELLKRQPSVVQRKLYELRFRG